MAWVNRGLIFKPEAPWTHGMLPVVTAIDDYGYGQINFSSRINGKSVLMDGDFHLETGAWKWGPVKPFGTAPFMRDGVSPLWLVDDSLYIMGWRKNKKWGVQETTGILDLKTGQITAPKVKPGYQVSVVTCLEEFDGIQTIYYDGADRFVSPILRYYSVKQRHFLNGIWLDQPTVVFPQIDNESRTSCFRVLGDEGWFCAADGDSRSYHIWEAKRTNGRWERVGQIDLETQDWDSESQCYPYPIRYNGQRVLFYSGNDYGRTGFGWAVEE